MSSEAWIAWRLLFSRRSLFGGSAPLALLGLMLGVGSLVAAMAVVSGFETTLQRSMADVTGHVSVVKRGSKAEPPEELEKHLREIEPSIRAATAFFRLEALLVAGGRIQGVLIQGTDRMTRDQVLDLRSRVVSGSLDMTPQDGVPVALVGSGIASQYHLSRALKFCSSCRSPTASTRSISAGASVSSWSAASSTSENSNGTNAFC